MDRKRKNNNRPFSWSMISSLSVSSIASTPFTDASSFDIMKKTSSMSALDLQNNPADEEEYYFTRGAGDDEPYFTGGGDPGRESFGVGDHFRQTSQRFRTKRFRSKLELGIV
jgi:hypothetical protein